MPPAQRHLEADALLRCEQLQEQAAQAISRWREWAEDGVCDESVKALATFLAAVAAAPAAHEVFFPLFERPEYMGRLLGPACVRIPGQDDPPSYNVNEELHNRRLAPTSVATSTQA